jgi:hypothetical protein
MLGRARQAVILEESSDFGICAAAEQQSRMLPFTAKNLPGG